MQITNQGKTGPEFDKSEMGLSRCLVDGDREANTVARRAQRKTFGLSVVIEILLVGLLVAAPLLTSTAQPQLPKIFPPQLTFIGDRGGLRQIHHAVSPSTVHIPLLPSPYAPPAPAGVTVRERHDEVPGDLFGPDLAGGDVAEVTPMPGIIETAPQIEPPHAKQMPPQEKHPLKLSEGVLEAQIISRIEPRYPPLAVQTRQSGTVVLHAIIDRDGRIGALEVVSGSPFFAQAALDAVRQWRYRPTLLNGEPVEVETTITVLFHLQR